MTIDTLPSPAEPVRALVTGGSGFIGTNLVESLLADRVPVLNFDMSTPRNSVQNDVHFTGNLLDLDSLRRVPIFGAIACRTTTRTRMGCVIFFGRALTRPA